MKFYNKKFAEEYDKRLVGEGYPGNLLDHIFKNIEGASTIIDVGAGSGFFTIPLITKGFEVTAVDPSPHMIEILRRKVPENCSNLLRIDMDKWESWQGEKADALICVHSIYSMESIQSAVLKMNDYSDKAVMVIKSDRVSKTLSEIIRKKFNTIRHDKNFYSSITSVLEDAGIEYKAQRDTFY